MAAAWLLVHIPLKLSAPSISSPHQAKKHADPQGLGGNNSRIDTYTYTLLYSTIVVQFYCDILTYILCIPKPFSVGVLDSDRAGRHLRIARNASGGGMRRACIQKPHKLFQEVRTRSSCDLRIRNLIPYAPHISPHHSSKSSRNSLQRWSCRCPSATMKKRLALCREFLCKPFPGHAVPAPHSALQLIHSLLLWLCAA